MRYLLVGVALVGAIGPATAQPLPENPYKKPNTSGVFLEIGGGWQRFQNDGVTYRVEYARFAPEVSLDRHLYIGAALEVGNIYSSYGKPDDAGTLPPVLQGLDRGIGTLMAPQLVLGVRASFDIFSVAGEVAPTIRWFGTGPNGFDGMGQVEFSTTMVLHGRADIWATPHISAGIMVGMDVSSIRDFQTGLVVGFHFEPYDAMKR